jgi:hypothetical protein
MVEDLLSRIEQELYERIEELYPAVDECDRLQADLEALEAIPEPPVVPEPPVEPEPSVEPESPIESESPVEPELPAALGVAPEPPYEPELPYKQEPSAVLNVDPDPTGVVLCFPANRKPTRTVAVSAEAVRPISTLSRPTSVPASEPLVSPKVARLMLAPRRPALERSGIPRVGALV